MTDVDETPTVPAAPRRSDFVRRRLQVIDTYLDLVLEGDLSPTPEAVAERAGVSRASFFRYFASLEELRNEAMGRVLERFADLFDLNEPSSATTKGRVSHFVGTRLRFHEVLHPLALLQRRHAAENDHAASLVDASRNLLADQVRSYFQPDLDHLAPARRDDTVTTIAVLTSVESWNQSTHSHGRTSAQVRRAWISAITAVLDEAGAPIPQGDSS